MAKKEKKVTQSGFEYELDLTAMNDLEVLEMIADVEESPLILPKLLTKILGKAQRDKLYDHVRTKEGTVPIDKVNLELVNMFNGSRDLKN